MIVRMDQLIAQFAAEQFDCAIGDYLVGIHVGGGAGAGLKNIHNKMLI